jgi:hypothetical protein
VDRYNFRILLLKPLINLFEPLAYHCVIYGKSIQVSKNITP